MKRKKGETVSLHCERCRWSTELPLSATEASTVVPCAHCNAPLYWHRCESCGLCYVGSAEPSCPICESPSPEELD